jgi:hypothetical protein
MHVGGRSILAFRRCPPNVQRSAELVGNGANTALLRAEIKAPEWIRPFTNQYYCTNISVLPHQEEAAVAGIRHKGGKYAFLEARISRAISIFDPIVDIAFSNNNPISIITLCHKRTAMGQHDVGPRVAAPCSGHGEPAIEVGAGR